MWRGRSNCRRLAYPRLTPLLLQVRLIQRTLDPLKGVEQVLVNPLSRIALVTHCADACCTPSDAIATQLNNQHLGASLQSTNEANEAAAALAARPWYASPQRLHAAVIWVLFVAAVACGAWGAYLAAGFLPAFAAEEHQRVARPHRLAFLLGRVGDLPRLAQLGVHHPNVAA